MKNTLSIKFKKKEGKLVGADPMMHHRLKQFIASLADNEIVHAILDVEEADNTKAQLAKIHAMIGEIASETGEDVKKTKQDVKDQCGLTHYIDNKKYYKSFADQSKEKLSDVIEKLYLIGDFLNVNFRKNL